MRRPPKKIEIFKPCCKCGTVTKFDNQFMRTCEPCKAINNKAARLRSQQLKKVNGKRYRQPYESVRAKLAVPKRPKPVFDPVLEASLLQSELESLFTFMEIRPSGPVVHYKPDTRAFRDLTRMYEVHR